MGLHPTQIVALVLMGLLIGNYYIQKILIRYINKQGGIENMEVLKRFARLMKLDKPEAEDGND